MVKYNPVIFKCKGIATFKLAVRELSNVVEETLRDNHLDKS